jgi:Ca2+-binding RTX toxin-like protein
MSLNQTPSPEGDDFVSHGRHILAEGAPWQNGHDYSGFTPWSANQGHLAGPVSAAGSSTVAITSGGITIDLIFDAAATAAPQSFRDGIEQAASILASTITDKITVNLNIDYAGTGGGAAAGPDSGYYESYTTVRSKLIGGEAAGDTTFNALPAGTSIQGQTQVAVWNAQEKLFGLMSPNDTTTDDGSAYFSTDIASNLLVGVALHELTHALGRVPYGSQPDIFDLFRFTTPGTRLFNGNSTAPASYFSLNNGVTKLADFGRNSDPSDFLNSGVQGPNDPFNEYYTGSTTQALTTVDLTILHALGFHLSSSTSTPPPPPTALPDLTISGLTVAGNTVNFVLNDTGSGSAPVSDSGLYLSTDKTITTADTLIGTFHGSALSAGGSQAESIALALPGNLAAGTYYIGVLADSTGQVTESNESNNASSVQTVVVGNANANNLSGSGAVLVGLAGNDTLTSTGGNSVFVGGLGSDTLNSSRSGNDQFVYNSSAEGKDRVSGFHTGDHFDFSSAGFGTGLATGGVDTGTLDPSHFIANATGPTTAAQEFWFNTTDHTLYYDADGSGSAAHPVAIAQLTNLYVLHNSDILLV